jgi:hypothetical protein
VLWKLRAIVYGGIAVVAALILIGSGGDEPQRFLEGHTTQDRTFTAELKDGRPAHVGTWFEGTCEDGRPWVLRWWAFDGKTSRFRFDDGVLRIHEKRRRDYRDGWIGDRDHLLEARIVDGRVTGTMRAVEVQRHTSGTTYTCKSGDVTFSAG